jgi:hypothetical protein
MSVGSSNRTLMELPKPTALVPGGNRKISIQQCSAGENAGNERGVDFTASTHGMANGKATGGGVDRGIGDFRRHQFNETPLQEEHDNVRLNIIMV